MQCDKCKVNPASVHVERIVNGIKTEYNLCINCAAQERGDTGTDMTFEKIIKEFLGSFIGNFGGNFIGGFMDLAPETSVKFDGEEPVCPVCSLSFNDFREEGKLGCAHCYKLFRPQIDAIVKNIHGSGEHLGKAPKKAPLQMLLQRENEQLRRMQREAIENEQYETAAEIRDKIKANEAAMQIGE